MGNVSACVLPRGLWRSVSGNCVITETHLFGNDAVVHFGVFSENHLCVMYYVCALLSTCLLSSYKAAIASVDVCCTDLQSSFTHSFIVFNLHTAPKMEISPLHPAS